MSLLVAIIGWGGAALVGATHGEAAGINTWFIAALSVGICSTLVAGQWWLIPTKAELDENQSIFALGVERGLGCGACPLRTVQKESAAKAPLTIV